MKFKTSLLRFSFLLLPYQLFAQSANLPQGSKHLHFLDRLEILMQKDPVLNFSGQKPLSRRDAVSAAETADSLDENHPGEHMSRLSKVDKYNLQATLMNNSEWVTGSKSGFLSKRPVWNTFYTTKADLLSVNEKDFFLAVNPVIQQQQSFESGNGQRVFLNAKGLTARGLIARKVGFDFYLTDTQERPPLYVQRFIGKHVAVPGAGFYKPYKTTAYDYFDARGSVYFTAAKYFNLQFGYDRNFIGNGYRSLLLSDFSNSYLFLKVNTRIWKLNYTNLFAELIPQFNNNRGDILLPKKYAAMHRLSINVTKWLNVGLSEYVIFGRTNRFEFSYLNPVIFLRSAEHQNGSPDNALVGIDMKANVGRFGQIYGQFMLDEFVLKELRAGRGWWGNKYAFQLGAKYINAFKIDNLDLQGEMNFVRPFTYSHYALVSNYTHYNQPLAHPFGAGFLEAVGILRYQPLPRLNIQVKGILFTQGADTSARNLGNNIFLSSNTRPFNYGFNVPSGTKSIGLNTSALVSFEIKENVFLDGSLLLRKLKVSGRSDLSSTSRMVTFGLRMNMFRREYDY